LGVVEYEDESGSDETAMQHLLEALRLRRKHGDQRGIAETVNNLGVLAQKREELGEAWQHYSDALWIEKDLRNTFGVGRALFNLGDIPDLHRDPCRAWRLYAAAELLFDEVGSPHKDDVSQTRLAVEAKWTGDKAALDTQRQTLKAKSLDDLIAWALATDEEMGNG
jgi:tetratricopeptide (TPR) repeat protein